MDRRQVMDTSRAKELFGSEAKIAFQAGLLRTIELFAVERKHARADLSSTGAIGRTAQTRESDEQDLAA